ncbi:sensor histidine kinase [Dactylosporangium sp. CA-052675]|uniref:sensor histidine kinase n=1 Tax=Dactylosporangium sp. CA-052675 TaxID=3239927 RepID=UPI003D92E14C
MRGRTVDWILAGSGFAAGSLMYVTGQWQAHVDARWLFAPLAVCCGALLLRRTAPVASVAVGTAAVAADIAIGPSLATPLVYTQVLYDACLHGSARLARSLLAASVVGSVVTAVACLVVVRDVRSVGLAVLLALVTVVPILTGTHVRHHRDQAAVARRSAEQVARLAEADRANAVAAERAGMARELHDVIANHLSAVAIHATAALSADLGPGGTREALTVIRENSVRGLAEMRRMVGFLRDSPSVPGNAPGGLAALDELVARAGLPVRLEVRGATGDVPVSVDLAAYRIVQESLTNALKHGDDSPITAHVTREPHAVGIRVTSGLPKDRTTGEGAGLIGMRERAALLGGTLTAGPDGDRWVVSARLPWEAA